MREKMHLVLYALIAAFIGLIVFEWGMDSGGLSGGGALAGKVNGRPIEYRQYDQVYNRLVDSFREEDAQRELTDLVERELHERAWDMLVNQIILEELFEKHAIHVEDDEVLAAVESDNPPMIILRDFIDPETGAIDRKKLDEARMNQENREFWLTIEDIIRRELMVAKLQQTLQAMVRVSDQELDALIEREYGSFSASFFVAPYSIAGRDSLFKVSEQEIEAYYNKNKELFREEPTRSLDYVVFSAVPTSRDSLTIKNELASLAEDFSSTADDSSFVSLQSDRADTFDKVYTRADFSPRAGNELFAGGGPKPGSVIGPVADRNTYRLIKVEKVAKGEEVARASHILIPFLPGDPSGEAQARKLAAAIMQEISSGTEFAQLAEKYSKDPGSAARGGDLGWFGRKSMVPEFDQAVFGAAPGKVVGPVRTQYGIHIIKVTGKDSTALTCSEVVRDIRPSGETLEKARRRAAEFQMEAEDNGFDKTYEAFGIEKYTTGPFTKTGMIPGLGYNNPVTRFAFSSSADAVSDIIQLESGFLVMRVAEKNDSGYRSLDAALQDMIRAKLLKKKEGDALDVKLTALLKEKNGSLDATASALGGLEVVNLDNVRFNTQSLPVRGADNVRLMEAIIGMEPGTVSKPVPVSQGRALIALHEKMIPENLDLEGEKARLRPIIEQAKKERFLQDYFIAERRAAEIEDMRKL